MEKERKEVERCRGGREREREVEWCVGKLEIISPTKPVGFLCGSIPVLTDNAFRAFHQLSSSSSYSLVPSTSTSYHQTPASRGPPPRYQILPAETDLNSPPVLSGFSEKLRAIGGLPSRTLSGDLPRDGCFRTSNLTRKCEALAVFGLVEYGDEIDVIAPADILKQIFKMPYSKARLSIAVHRIGQTLILSAGPDFEEGERLLRGHQSKCADHSLFLNFAMHSVRMEACDCPPTHKPASSNEQSPSSALSGGQTSSSSLQHHDVTEREQIKQCSGSPQVKHDSLLWRGNRGQRNKRNDPVKKTSHFGEKPRCAVQESEWSRKFDGDGFLRVFFWQFHNFRMLLGSDLLLFSNEKYAAVSLHLWDITRQVTPLTWLEAWLDNVMASVPELAICYHENGVVQGYELLKTEDIFLLKGISEDGTPAFSPHVVQQNGLSVLRFLQENCKQDPGAYWLYKSSGEDVIQLFDLSVIPKGQSPSSSDDNGSSLPSLVHKGRSDSLFTLGTVLYRIAHQLSLSMTPTDKAKCARFIRKCLDFLDGPDHLVVRAFAHEQYARLILNNGEDVDVISECLPVECELVVTDAEEDFLGSFCDSIDGDDTSLLVEEESMEEQGTFQESSSHALEKMISGATANPKTSSDPYNTKMANQPGSASTLGCNDVSDFCETAPLSELIPTVSDHISSKLAAIHHISQAIKSLRWMRQVQTCDSNSVDCESGAADTPLSSMKLSVCACGDADCIEVCDIREWLPTSKLDHKLWKLVLLLGESYLALARAYKEERQLHQALEVVELACSVYGSMPRHLEDTQFISSMVKPSVSISKIDDTSPNARIKFEVVGEANSSDDNFILENFSYTHFFWAKAWTLVGDIYVEWPVVKGQVVKSEAPERIRELRMSSEVVKEVKRLKKKLGQYKQNCSSCSLVNCSCQSDRASSGSSASSSSGGTHDITYGRRPYGKRLYCRGPSSSCFGEEGSTILNVDGMRERKNWQHRGSSAPKESLNSIQGTMAEKTTSAAYTSENSGDLMSTYVGDSAVPTETKPLREMSKGRNGGIFRYTEGVSDGDAENNLISALSCYEEARKALEAHPASLTELQSVIKKKGWVCNELGRSRLERKELKEAEAAFLDAINAFTEVSDHTNVILIYCNMGHGRRALAEEMVAKAEHFKLHPIWSDSYDKVLQTAKSEYAQALKFYGAAKSKVNSMDIMAGSAFDDLKNEVYTQLAHTFLRLGMLLAKEDIAAELYENAAFGISSGHSNSKVRSRKRTISANDAIREAISLYESLGGLRNQEAAYAYFHLACYQKKGCLKFVNTDHREGSVKGESAILQRVKQYASLAEWNWQKAIDFYGPKTHPMMYITIQTERSELLLSLSSTMHSTTVLESALSHLLEGRHVCEAETDWKEAYSEIHAKFWNQLQMVLKKMLSVSLSSTCGKPSTPSRIAPASNRSEDAMKLKELYKLSLISNDLSQLHAMHRLWTR